MNDFIRGFKDSMKVAATVAVVVVFGMSPWGFFAVPNDLVDAIWDDK